MKVIKVSVLLKALEDDGWYIAAQKGSYRQLKHPSKQRKVTLNGKNSNE